MGGIVGGTRQSAMHFMIELERTGQAVVGSASWAGREPVPFSGWLELLALLEAPQPAIEADND